MCKSFWSSLGLVSSEVKKNVEKNPARLQWQFLIRCYRSCQLSELLFEEDKKQLSVVAGIPKQEKRNTENKTTFIQLDKCHLA